MWTLLLWLMGQPEYNYTVNRDYYCAGRWGKFPGCLLLVLALVGSVLSVGVDIMDPDVTHATDLSSVLTWQNADTINSVEIDKAGGTAGPFVKIGSVAPGVLTYTDTTNAPGLTACYRVENANSSGNGPSSNIACKSFPPLPTVAPVLGPVN